MKYKPVFIIGAGRSGTKYLRDILAVSSAVVYVPYDIGYIWRTGNEWLPHDEIDAETVSAKSMLWIRQMLPKLIDRDAKKMQATILLEKSVPNSLRPLLLYKAFPNATFIHLVRDGRAVTESAMRMWQTPPEKGYLINKIRYFPWGNFRYGFWYFKNMFLNFNKVGHPIWGPRYKGIEEDVRKEPLHVVCARQWFHCVNIGFKQLSQIPCDNVITVRYEEIMAGTHAVLGICEKLGIDSVAVLEHHLASMRAGENEKWRKSLTQEIQKDINAIFDQLPIKVKEFVFGEKPL